MPSAKIFLKSNNFEVLKKVMFLTFNLAQNVLEVAESISIKREQPLNH